MVFFIFQNYIRIPGTNHVITFTLNQQNERSSNLIWKIIKQLSIVQHSNQCLLVVAECIVLIKT